MTEPTVGPEESSAGRHLENLGFRVELLRNDVDAGACARIMATSEPWITLGRSYDASLEILQDPTREVHVLKRGSDVVGFMILNMRGAFIGYIQTIALREDCRSQGLGTLLIELAEERIFREAPNVFLCVSSFNERARKLYERLGYKVVGELEDFIVAGYSEWLLRKTREPIAGFTVPERE
ncbi:MAG TPA: GNAT family N-acetyltransferase [Gemmatimonadaceae bacterium]|nr:GNAT family N-acetyltransferase [Gemmatimonadaceae bacterium]